MTLVGTNLLISDIQTRGEQTLTSKWKLWNSRKRQEETPVTNVHYADPYPQSMIIQQKPNIHNLLA